MVLETRADTVARSPGLIGARGEMVEYSDMGSDRGKSLSLFSASFLLFISPPGDSGGISGCAGGRGARYLTLQGCV